jgi:predicted transcriptional regulator
MIKKKTKRQKRPDREIVIYVESSKQRHRNLETAAKVIDRTMGQLAREAIDEKLDRLAEIDPRIKEALASAA